MENKQPDMGIKEVLEYARAKKKMVACYSIPVRRFAYRYRGLPNSKFRDNNCIGSIELVYNGKCNRLVLLMYIQYRQRRGGAVIQMRFILPQAQIKDMLAMRESVRVLAAKSKLNDGTPCQKLSTRR